MNNGGVFVHVKEKEEKMQIEAPREFNIILTVSLLVSVLVSPFCYPSNTFVAVLLPLQGFTTFGAYLYLLPTTLRWNRIIEGFCSKWRDGFFRIRRYMTFEERNRAENDLVISAELAKNLRRNNLLYIIVLVSSIGLAFCRPSRPIGPFDLPFDIMSSGITSMMSLMMYSTTLMSSNANKDFLITLIDAFDSEISASG